MPFNVPENLHTLRNRLINEAFLGLLVLSVPAAVLSVWRITFLGWRPVFALHLVLIVLLILVWLRRNYLAYSVRIGMVLVGFWSVAIAGLMQFGLVAGGREFAVLFALTSMLFIGGRLGIWLIVGNIACTVLIAIAAVQQWLHFDLDYQTYIHHPAVWAAYIWTFGGYSLFVGYSVWRLIDCLGERENGLREALDHQQKIAANVPGVIYQFLLRRDGSTCFPYASEGTLRLFGLDPEQLREDASAGFSLVHPDDIDGLRKSIERSAHSLLPVHETFRILHPTFGVVWVERNSTPERLANGDTLWHGFMRNVTEQKLAEQRLSATLENTPNVAVQWYDRAGYIHYWNRASEIMYGWKSEEVIGKRLDQLLLSDVGESSNFFSALEHIENSGETVGPVEYSVHHRDGSLRVISSTTFAIQSSDAPLFACMDIDVTERRQLEQMQSQILESLPDAVVLSDESGTITLVNTQTLSMFGYQRDELIGAAVEILLPKNLRDSHFSSRLSYRDKPGVDPMAMGSAANAVTKDGREIPVEINLGRVNTQKAVLFVASIRDVSARKLSELALRQEHDRAQRYLDTVQTVMVSLDRSGNIVMINRKGCELLGYEEKELIGRNWFEHCLPSPYGMDTVYPCFLQTISGEQERVTQIDAPVLCRDGRKRLVSWRNAYLTSDLGEVIGVLSSGEDVTEQIHAMVSLREVEQRFSFAVEGVGDGVWDWNMQTNEMVCSLLYLSMLGYDENELPHHFDTWANSVHPEDMPRVKENLEAYLGGVLPNYAVELRLRCKDDGYKWILCRGMVVARDISGKPLRMIGIHTDISERKQLENKLVASSQAKSAFLASMSHELRTPLNAIIGFAQMLDIGMSSPLDQAQREAVGHILSSGRLLLQLINEVLDMARIEAGRLNLTLEPVELGGLIEEVLALTQSSAAERKIDLCWKDAKELYVFGDRFRVRQILLNLLSNSVKYNRLGGKVTLTCQASKGMVRIMVTDTGSGIPDDCQSEIFKPFQRLGAERTAIEGTGIGLVVCKQLAEAMDGQIGFVSEIGAGSSFWVDIPQVQAKVQVEAKEIECVLETKTDTEIRGTVLYIEDNPVNRTVMEHIFRYLPGAELLTIEDAETGLLMVREQSPALVLMDIDLPGMSGIDALRILKSDPITSSVPVIAISAAAMPQDIQAGLDAGFTAYHTKPLDVAVLLAQLKNILQSNANPPLAINANER